jgi:hypothetical protein
LDIRTASLLMVILNGVVHVLGCLEMLLQNREDLRGMPPPSSASILRGLMTS